MKKTVLATVLVFILLGLCCACGTKPVPDYSAIRTGAWEAEIRGERDGAAFSAKIGVTPAEENTAVWIEYLTPDTLCGISVTATCDADGRLYGTAELRRGETVVNRDAADFRGLLEPTLCWFSLDTHTAVQKEGDSFVLQFPDGVSVALDETGVPRSYSSPSLRYDVIWLEKGNVEKKG